MLRRLTDDCPQIKKSLWMRGNVYNEFTSRRNNETQKVLFLIDFRLGSREQLDEFFSILPPFSLSFFTQNETRFRH